MEDVYLNLSKTRVFAKSAGSPKNPLILGIHGWSQRNGWHTWEPLMQPLADAGFYVVSLDMPGWGKSSALSSSMISGQEATGIIIEIIDDLQKDKAAIMGKSWGGGIAVKSAVEYPNRVSHLILSAPALRNLDQLTLLTQPVLLAWAEDDPVIPITYARRFIDVCPQTKLITYEAGGHSAAPNNADDFAPKAIAFLTSG